MKSLIVRLSVLAIATTGFAASTIASQPASKKHIVKPVIVGTICPAPMCPYHDPNFCGLH